MLPRVKLEYGNGALARAIAITDGLLCIIDTDIVEVPDKFYAGKPYSIRRLGDLVDLGITSNNNPHLYNTVRDFYTEAPEGTRVFIAGYSGLSMSDMVYVNGDGSVCILDILAQQPEIRGFIITMAMYEAAQIVNGLDSDIPSFMLWGQQAAQLALERHNAPIFILGDGLHYNGDSDALVDLKTFKYNRMGLIIGSTRIGSGNQAIGLVAGRIARAQVQRNIARVKDGSLQVSEMYAFDKKIERADIETIHDKGYITFRTFTGMSGYYISDDPMATSQTDDYNQLTRRRTIDKAYRVAYPVFVEELLDEIPVNADGTMLETVAVAIEQKVQNAIAISMTARGELSSDPSDANDQGVICEIDRTVNVIATDQIKASLRVRPFGYPKYIDVLLGFTVIQN